MQPGESISGDELIQRIKAGDTAALAKAIDLYGQILYRIAYGIVRRADLAQDAVQNTFITLWERRDHISITGSFSSYLHVSVRNKAIKLIRHEDAERRVQDAVTARHQIAIQNEGEVRLESDEIKIAFDRALEALQPRLREIFLMRRFNEMAYEQIADALGISVISVRSQMSRAVQRLAEALKGGR